ncbi:MAG: transcription termination factor Rho, partial [Micromonosporaceae bacterium]
MSTTDVMVGVRNRSDARATDNREPSRPANRNRRVRAGRPAPKPVVANVDDDVLVAMTGVVDVLDNYALVRTSGYAPGPDDVYVSMAQIKKYGLRRGDLVLGEAASGRSAHEGGPRRDKYKPLVRLDTINGMDPEEARRRPEFYKLTPLYPQERLRLETEPHILTTRVIDLVMPIGKGQ